MPNILSVVLMRRRTDAWFDMEQRLVALSFSAGSGVLNVTHRPTGISLRRGTNAVPMNASGVPSVPQFVQLTPAPADVSSHRLHFESLSNVTITRDNRSFSTDRAAASDGTISAYSWTFPGGSPSTSSLAIPWQRDLFFGGVFFCDSYG